MLNIQPKRAKITDPIRRTVLVVVFLIVATLVIGYNIGYRVDLKTKSLKTTGAISLTGNNKDVKVYLDGKQIGTELPLYISNLTPDQTYQVSVSKDGYNQWSHKATVQSSVVNAYGPIILFKNNYAPVSAEEVDAASMCQSNTPFGKTLVIDNSALYIKKDFVTRVSAPIISACWFKDSDTIAYVVDKNIYAIESDGNNNVEVYSAASAITKIGIDSKNSTIYFFDGQNWYKLGL